MILSFFDEHPFYLAALLIYIPLAILWNYLRHRKMPPCDMASEEGPHPLPLSFGFTDHLKALISWVFLFMRVFWIQPGLYYGGEKDDSAPLLVTTNNFLTVFLLTRRTGKRNIRLLVIDTKGINVWCSAGKGTFSAGKIIRQATASGLLREGEKIRMILPKFSLSGVKLAELKKAGIIPVIGPLYARDVPAYLDQGEWKNRTDDKVRFHLKSRALTALPAALQFFYYFLGVYVLTLNFFYPCIIWTATALAFCYPLLYPWLPGKQFAVKGLSLATLVSAVSGAVLNFPAVQQLSITVFIFATSLFVALSFTGNSAVSNYTRVREETARFLPVTAGLYVIFILLHLIK